MTGEVHLPELRTVKDGSLDSRITQDDSSLNGGLQSQWQVICDGLKQGAGAQIDAVKDNYLLTGVGMAGSFGLGAGMSLALRAGGGWGAAAGFVAAGFTGLMALDVKHRYDGISDAYSNSDANSVQGQAMRRDAIANYAGAGLVDYSLMLGSGGLGAASAHFGPKLAGSLSTALEPLSNFARFEPTMEPALVPARGRNFNLMDLGDSGRLGAKELPVKADPISDARNSLEFPHRSVGLDQLASLMVAKQIAAHPDVKPIYQKTADTLGQVDLLKPKISLDEQALSKVQRELADAKSLKTEMQAVRQAESNISGLKTDMDSVSGLREQQAALTRQIQEAKAADSQPAEPRKAADKDAPASEDLRAQRREISDSITNIQARAAEMPKLQERLNQANEAFGKRRSAIEKGEDAQVNELTARVETHQTTVDGGRAQLAELSEALRNLNNQYRTAADAVRPTLKDSAQPPASDVPKYTKPKIEDLTSRSKKTTADTATPPPLTITENGSGRVTLRGTAGQLSDALSGLETPSRIEARSGKLEIPAELRESLGLNARPATLERPVVEPKIVVEPKTTVERTNAAATDTKGSEQIQPAKDKIATSDRAAISEADLSRAGSEARKAVDDFSATHKRHTTALKKLTDYIDTAFTHFAGDSKAAADVTNVAANVDAMLGKLENWERPPAWIRQADKAPLMQRNGMTAAEMDRFDKWYQSQAQTFSDNPSMSPERRLLEIREHLSRRVAVESVKNWLRMAPDVQKAVSPIVQDGFDAMASGKTPDGREIPKGSDMIVFEKVNRNGQDMVLPFAKDGQHVQRFDDNKIAEGLRKFEAMSQGGPQALNPDDLYGFRLDHDPARLLEARQQVGYAILRPGGQYGKNILYMQFAPELDSALIPKVLKADSSAGVSGTNTGVLYNMVKNAGRPAAGRPPGAQ